MTMPMKMMRSHEPWWRSLDEKSGLSFVYIKYLVYVPTVLLSSIDWSLEQVLSIAPLQRASDTAQMLASREIPA